MQAGNIKVVITGVTGMAGEGVLHECLQHPAVSEVLVINRRPCGVSHSKLKEIIHANFFDITPIQAQLAGYDACYFCLGLTSVGKKEAEYFDLTYNLTTSFAETLCKANGKMQFFYISGAGTDSSEKGRTMWARVKGKTENDLVKLGFKAAYNFRPGVMLPFNGQKNWPRLYKFIAKLFKFFSPKNVLTMQEVGKAMINCVTTGYSKNILEISDIKALAKP